MVETILKLRTHNWDTLPPAEKHHQKRVLALEMVAHIEINRVLQEDMERLYDLQQTQKAFRAQEDAKLRQCHQSRVEIPSGPAQMRRAVSA